MKEQFGIDPIHHERKVSKELTRAPETPQVEIPYTDYYKYFNKLQANGRVNSGYDSAGKLVALSVPPFIPNFIQNIDPGVRSLIQALLDKNYLPISSCAGHSILDTRYVSLCFNHPPSAILVSNILSKISWIYLERKKSVSNINLKLVPGGMSLSRVEPKITDEHRRCEVSSLNHLFKRDADTWVYLDIHIGEPVFDFDSHEFLCQGFLKDIYRVIRKVYHRLTRERMTARLISLINSDEFPFYLW